MERLLRKKLKGGQFQNLTPKRSRAMQAVRGKGNRSTEIALKMAMVSAGIRGWRLHSKEIPGCPDFYFPQQRVAVFVDGCFWHGCPKCGHIPKNNRSFWALKLRRTKERDKRQRRELRRTGVCVVHFWEHEIQSKLRRCLAKIHTALE